MRIAVLHVRGIDLGILTCLADAFRRLGHRVRVWRVPEVDESVKSPAPGAPSEVARWERLCAAVRRFRPDFGFGLDTFPLLYEPPRHALPARPPDARPSTGNGKPETRNSKPETLRPEPLRHLFAATGVPLALFWTNDPIRSLLGLESMPPMGMSRTAVTHFVPDTAAAAALRRLGLRSRYLPLGTSFHEARPFAGSLARFRAEVAFAGHASVRETGAEALRARYGPWYLPLLRRACRLIVAGEPPLRALADSLVAVPPPFRAAAGALCDLPREVGQLLRYACAGASVATRCRILAGLGRPVVAYGDAPDWPLDHPRIARRPAVDYRRELPAVYRATAVNLNVTGPQFATAVNQRVFDVPAAGGFLLTDRRADLGRHFAIGREVIVYDDVRDLRGKVRWYLSRPRERRRAAERARARIAREHTWVDRARGIVREMG